MGGLKVLLMGSPRIEVDGAPIEVDTRKAIALLAYLALEGEAARRDSLAALLWPEYESEAARGALRRTLSTLKGGLGGRWLRIDRSTVEFAPDESTSADVTEFNSLISAADHHDHGSAGACPDCERDLAAAAALYRADFMKGFSLRDSIDFEDWQVFQSENLRREYGRVLERLVGLIEARGDLEGAIEKARKWLSLDVLHEPAHRRLMTLLARAGDRAGALRAYREFVAILDTELGVAPLTETTDLYQAIQEGRVAPPDVVPPKPLPAFERAEPPRLIGREKEMGVLEGALEAAADGGQVVAIEGEAGIGKTSLAEAFIERASEGSIVVASRCYEEEMGHAYSPIIDALQSALTRTQDWVSDVPEHVLVEGARLIPSLSQVRPEADLNGPGAHHRFLEAVSNLLVAACSGGRPGILFFDDVQWADDAAIDVLAHLVRRLKSQRTLLLLTWRTESVAGDDRIRSLLATARGQRVAAEIELQRLGRAEVAEMVRGHVIDTPQPEALHERLFAESEGIPLFVTEYVAALAERSPEEETWPLPGGVRDLLKQRLAAVGETGAQVLAAAAALGRSFDFDTVREVSGRTDDEVVEALDELVGRQLIFEVEPEPAYDFSHEKLRTLVYEEAGLARRRLLHRRAASALQRGHAGDPSRASVVARHLHLGGMDTEAADFYRRAGDYARSLHAHIEALAHFSSALALGHPEAATLHDSSGDVHTLLGNYAEALANYEAAAALCGDPSPSIEHKIGGVHLRRGDYGLAERHFEESLARHGPGAASSRILADWSMAAHGAGDTKRSRELADRALRSAEESADPSALCRAHNVVGLLATRRGELDDGASHLEASLRLSSELGDEGARVAALNNLALTHRAAGEYDEAIELTLEGLKLCAALGDRHREAALHNNLADLLRASDRSEEAMGHLKQAVAIFAEVGEPGEMEPEIWKLVEW